MNDRDPIAVTSLSFSRHPVLRSELLARYADVRFNDEGVSLAGDELVAFLRGCKKAITALEQIDDALLEQLPELEVISKIGVGLDMIDQDALERHNVRLAWSAGTNAGSVAELTVCFALALLRRLPEATAELAGGGWRQPIGQTLATRTVGVIGFGHVGREVARLFRALGCNVVAHDVQTSAAAGVEWLGLDELLSAADVVTLHVSLDETTRNLIDGRRLALMKEDAILINTARGRLIDEGALADALKAGRLGGAGLDVFAEEPPRDRTLLSLPNILATPHIGGSTEEAILAMGRAAIAGLDS